MVTLSRIYTRAGDGGQTRIGDLSEVAKTDPRVEAYGTVDELNATLGLALEATGIEPEARRVLSLVQHDLLDLGADLCRPLPEDESEGAVLRVVALQVTRLEQEIDRANAPLEPLRSFVLPGGSPAASRLHLARTVCRRAERRTWALAAHERVNPQALIYLNRLSDLLFVLARQANAQGRTDRLWEPGLGRSETGMR
jgi:cob(I)alamin adenosyltransferase